jgi:sulfur carrier protein ThiS adenylyltransferase
MQAMQAMQAMKPMQAMKGSQLAAFLLNKRIGIAGCGGLGSNCAVALARIGVGTLVIADYDLVSPGNLNRQYYFRDQVGMKKTEMLKQNIHRIDPQVNVIAHDLRLTPGNITEVFSGCDVIVEAFDLAGEKQMLIETLSVEMPDVPLVTGLGMAGWGMSNAIHCRKADNIYICGDETSEVSADFPPLAPRVGIVANMQANVVVEILIGSEIAK